MSAGRGTCRGCGEWDDDLANHLCEHDWRSGLRAACELLEEYGRHGVTLACQCCGTGFGDPHGADCKIGLFIAEYGE